MHVLPKNLKAMADLAPKESGRWSNVGILCELADPDAYTVVATDSKVLGVVTGPVTMPAADYPAPPALASAPNGATSILFPLSEWKAAFTAAGKVKHRSESMKAVAVVAHKPEVGPQAMPEPGTVTYAVGTPGMQTVGVAVSEPGRYPPYKEVLPRERDAVASARLSADDFLRLVKTAGSFADDVGVTLTIYRAPSGSGMVGLYADLEGGQSFRGLIMAQDTQKVERPAPFYWTPMKAARLAEAMGL